MLKKIGKFIFTYMTVTAALNLTAKLAKSRRTSTYNKWIDGPLAYMSGVAVGVAVTISPLGKEEFIEASGEVYDFADTVI